MRIRRRIRSMLPARPDGPDGAERHGTCPRCGNEADRLLDPEGRWFVCARCGKQVSVEGAR